jgi:hypothetical protein
MVTLKVDYVDYRLNCQEEDKEILSIRSRLSTTSVDYVNHQLNCQEEDKDFSLE